MKKNDDLARNDIFSWQKKIFRIMKLTTFLIFISICSVFAGKTYSQNKTLTFKMDKTTIKNVLSKIEDQSDFYFMYNSKLIDAERKVSVNVKNEKVKDVLNHLFGGTDVGYVIKGRFIVLTKDGAGYVSSASQQQKLTGKITDKNGQPLPGVAIVIKGTSRGVVTDMDGKYNLINIPANATIQVSFIGMTTQEVFVGNKHEINIKMQDSAIDIDEVVAIGYGTSKKSDLTGSVSSLDSKQLTKSNKVNISQALQGQIAGVDIHTLNGKPGGGFSINIRGNSVITNNNASSKDGISDDPDDDLSTPLYVVDGIYFDNIDMLNLADIEKMNVLKDASATAIYGSRGANGVVIISTKNGIEGEAQVSYEGTFGFKNAVNRPDMFTGDEYVAFVSDVLRGKQWRNTINEGNGTVEGWTATNINTSSEFQSELERDNVANHNYTDWAGDYLKTGISTSHSVNLSGGKDGFVYNASVAYLHDGGIMGDEGYDRYNAATSISKKFDKKWQVGLKTNFAYSNQEAGSRELFRSTLRLVPTVSSTDPETGDIILFPDAQDSRFLNPYYEAEQKSWKDQTRRTELMANFFVDYNPSEWFNFKSTFAPNISYYRNGEYRGLLTKSSRNTPSLVRAYYNTANTVSYTWDNVANFNYNIKKGHNLKATLISSLYYNQNEGSNIEARNFDVDSYSFYNTGAGTDVRTYGSFYQKQTIASFAARLNYNIKERYLFTVTGRYDGSSKLAEGNKWQFFPSAAFGWRMSEEDFMKEIDWLSNLKLRLSYGESGNDNTVSPYSSMAFLGTANYLDGDNLLKGKYVNGLSNSDLGWEISHEYNLGLDYGFFGNRINGSIDLYHKRTDNSIFARELYSLTGYSSAVGNYGSVINKGVEFSINSRNIMTNNFSWTTNLNFAKNVNKIDKIEGDLDYIIYGEHGILKVGEPVDAVYAYEDAGIWQMDEINEAAKYNAVPGQQKFVDQNNDGLINESDKTVIGSRSPDWTAGITNSFTYKDFDLSFMIYTRQGVKGHSEFYQNFAPYGEDGAKFNRLALNYWTPENQDGDIAIPGVGYYADWNYEDMSFVKVGNIGFGYKLPEFLLNKVGINSVRLSLDVQNPFTFTGYKGPDPETGLQNSYNATYQVRTILFGLKVKF